MEQHKSKIGCPICNKKYTKKSSFDRHHLLCEFRMKTLRERQIEEEEEGDIPTYNQLVKIVQELMLKQINMQEKIDEMQKWMERKKKKINIIAWLNENAIPTIGFLEWVHTSINIKPEHFEDLMDNTIFHTIQKVFEDNLLQDTNFEYPIRCFSQKIGMFYIGEKLDNGMAEWRPLVLEDMILILRKIQSGIIKQLTNWKQENQDKFHENDKIAILFNKTVIKATSISFSPDNFMSRIKNALYNYLKKDLKTVEFNFEF